MPSTNKNGNNHNILLKMQSIFRAAPIGIGVVIDRVIVEANERFCRMTGYSRDEMLNKSAMFLYPTAADYEYVGSEKYRQIARYGTGTVETRWKKKDGEIIDVLLSSTPIDPDDLSKGVTFTALDITVYKRNEENIRLLGKIADIAPATILVHDFDGNIIYANERAFMNYGYTREDFMSLGLKGLDAPEASELRVGRMQELIDKGEVSFEVNHLCKDGTVKPMHVFARLIDWKGKKVALSVSSDLTEGKKAEEERRKLLEQLFQSQKLESIGTLAGGIAHDFNNMLGIIIGYAELLLSDVEASHPLRESLEKIFEAAHRSAHLTRQLLTFARRQSAAPEVLELNESIESVLKMLRRLIGENIDLAWLPSSGRCAIKIDRSQLEQILMNLCVNARDAIIDIGKITIETGKVTFDETYCATHAGFIPGEYIRLTISDTGCGMDDDTKKHLFEPFFTTKGIGKGTGLGLSTVYGIVKQNSGYISFYSEPGSGTVFNIYFPENTEEDTEKNLRPADIPRGRGEAILVIEDDLSYLKMTGRMLENIGYSAVYAGTTDEAIRLLQERPDINLFLTDVIMPEMNGRDLADRLLAIRPGIRHIFMSGYTANIIVEKGILNESVNLIHKPFSTRDLAVKIREVLE